MKVQTTRFGEIEVSEKSILRIPDGMIGFEQCKEFVLLEYPNDTQLRWLQAIGEPSLAFIVVNPLEVVADYEVQMPDEEAATLGLTDAADAVILTTVTINAEDGQVTTNLLGPIVVNQVNLLAKQIVLQDGRYGTKYMIGQKPRAEASTEAVAA